MILCNDCLPGLDPGSTIFCFPPYEGKTEILKQVQDDNIKNVYPPAQKCE